MGQLYTQRAVAPDSWDLSGAPATTVICLAVDATINYSDGSADTLPANTPAVLPDATTAFDRTHDVYVPYTVQGSGVLSIIKESLLPTLTSDYAPLARVELHGIKPYQPEPYLVAGGLGNQSGTTVTLVSDVTALALSLWNGSSNDAPPAGWQTTGYNDSAWSAAVVTADDPLLEYIAGAKMIWPPAGIFPYPDLHDDGALLRHHLTPPAGTLVAATLQVAVDDLLEGLYLNGTAVGTVPFSFLPTPATAVQSYDVHALLTPGADNVLALWVLNHGSSVDIGGNFNYKLTLTYAGSGSVVAPPGTPAEGDLLYYHNGAWTDLPIGPSGDVVTSDGTDPGWATPSGGSVTSVQVTVPAPLSASGGPITASGAITLAWASGQTANRVLASPNGSSGAVSLRALVGNDIPVDASTIVSSAGVIKGNYQAGSGVSISGNTISATGSGGSVTSVALSLPSSVFSTSGSPVTTSGTLAVSLATQSAATVFAGPASGSAAAPTFRKLASQDLPPAAAAGGNIHAHGHFH